MKLFSKITLEHIDACFVFMSTLSWVCVVFYTVHQETQSKHVSKSDFGFGKMENLEPINFPIPVIWFTGSMRTEFHHVVVFSLKKIPISHHFFFKMNCIQMALTATMSGLMSDRVHPKVDVIWLVNFDIPTIKMDRCIFLPAVTCFKRTEFSLERLSHTTQPYSKIGRRKQIKI